MNTTTATAATTERKNLTHLKTGDIVCSTYGYGLSPVEFAVITHTTDRSVYYQEISRETESGDWMDYYAVPNQEDYKAVMETINNSTPKEITTTSHRKNIYYKTRKNQLMPNDGINSKTGAYYTAWNGKPVHGNCD